MWQNIILTAFLNLIILNNKPVCFKTDINKALGTNSILYKWYRKAITNFSHTFVCLCLFTFILNLKMLWHYIDQVRSFDLK